MKLTADTITDEQIRELYEDIWRDLLASCVALGFHPPPFADLAQKVTSMREIREARARCAEILNARAEAKP